MPDIAGALQLFTRRVTEGTVLACLLRITMGVAGDNFGSSGGCDGRDANIRPRQNNQGHRPLSADVAAKGQQLQQQSAVRAPSGPTAPATASGAQVVGAILG